MVYDPFQDTAQIIDTILNQPINVPDLEEDITLLHAALDFKDETPENSALHKILRNYLEFPESRDALLRELELLAGELNQ
jgi:hypothetical protein